MKLKPCPFCGKVQFIELDYIEHGEKSRPYGDRYVGKVKCVLCGVSVVSSGFHGSVESAYHAAAERWNRRVGHEPAGECTKHNRAERGSWCGEEGEK